MLGNTILPNMRDNPIKGAGFWLLGKLKCMMVVFNGDKGKIWLRVAGLLLLASVSYIDHLTKNFYNQINVDFLYFLPILLLAYISSRDSLFAAGASAILRFMVSPVDLDAAGGRGLVSFFIVLGGYILVALTCNNLVRAFKLAEYQRKQLGQVLISTTAAMVRALDARDHYTATHSYMVAGYALAIARQLGLSSEEQENLYLAGLLHDIGKIAVRDVCLNKPGPLGPEEVARMHRHPVYSHDIIKDIPGLMDVAAAVLYHHERFDGRGYPNGLSGKAIPLGARILCVADSFDAMVSDRVYRSGMPVEVAVDELRRCAGSQFDPQVVEAFCFFLARKEPVPHLSGLGSLFLKKPLNNGWIA